MKYDPKEAGGKCWPDGIYKAHIEKAEEGVAKSSGKDMITFTFVLHDKTLGSKRVPERMVVPSTLWKLKNLAEAIGKTAAFESGDFNARDYVGANLEVEITTESSPGYADKNVIMEFIALQAGAPKNREDDDPPF